VLTASDARAARITIRAANREAFILGSGLDKNTDKSNRYQEEKSSFVLIQYIKGYNTTYKM